MSNKEVLILFGTETGNAEDLADQAGNEANKYDLEADIRGMDEVTIDELVTSKRVIIFCSTWGDGEQPYNAQDLFDATSGLPENSMNDLYFAVLALGDTAFDLFCESGKEWDQILEDKGGNRVNPRVDCDVDYEAEADIWMHATLEMMKKIE